jgi:hypothetical protein
VIIDAPEIKVYVDVLDKIPCVAVSIKNLSSS